MESGAAYPVFDIDTHYYEPADCFTRHMEPRFRELAVHWRDLPDGRKLFVGDRPYTFVKDPTFSFVEKPGNLAEMLRQGIHALEGGGDKLPPPPEFVADRDRRLAVLDQQGIEGCLMFPTLAVTIEHFMRHDPVQTFANVSSFNKWLEEDWGYAYKNRIYAVPLLSLLDVDLAVAELDRVLALGAKAIHLMPGPQGNRSPADPAFDPFWARLNEAKVPVALHISESGYNELFSTAWGEQANPTSHEQSAFQWTNFFGDRPIMDTVSSMIYMNLFGKFPNVKVFSVENGSLWVNYIVKAMDKMKGMGRNGPWPGGYVKGKPSEIFKRHVFVSPYFEEDFDALAAVIGYDQVLFGSDYPHSEGLADPLEYKNDIAHMPIETQARIMGGNARDLLGISA
ncbi:amidohydrolase family protein [Novosphingobium sp.]|uniref:amidohydrolase family protein n=1 Tax=Novosphingobium sp. TaxID=1874826 RepID=UPI003BAB7059